MEELISLVRSAQAGDRAAFDLIVRKFQDGAVGYGYSLLGNFHQAEDAAQEAFLRAYLDLPTLQEPAAFPGWLRRIIFKCCDRIRRRKQIPVMPLGDAAEIACQRMDPHQTAQEAQMKAQVQEAFSGLSEADRTIITLFYMSGHSQEEIAAFLQIHAATVRKRLQRAKSRLKERMLSMVEETLNENAPSRDSRFAERASLLRRIAELLERDERIVAAWLSGALGRGSDDVWSAPKLNVVVKDEAIDEFAAERRSFAAGVARPLLYVEAPQNATPGGYYLMTLYDGEAGPYEIDWYWHLRSAARLPSESQLLFDRAGLPLSDQPMGLNNSDMPPALKRMQEDMSDDERRAEEGRNTVSLFWAMLLITAKYVARNPHERRMGFLDMLLGLLRDTQNFIGAPSPAYEAPPHLEPAVKLKVLRHLAKEMETLMPRIARKGSRDVPFAAVPAAYRFLDMIEATLQAEGKL